MIEFSHLAAFADFLILLCITTVSRHFRIRPTSVAMRPDGPLERLPDHGVQGYAPLLVVRLRHFFECFDQVGRKAHANQAFRDFSCGIVSSAT
jgi:hypothetical protein